MMKRIVLTNLGILVFGFALLPLYLSADTAGGEVRNYSDAGFYAAGSELTPSEQAGRDIWYKATAGNGRFHTYVFQQRLGIFIDWFRVLRADQRQDRFKTWGLVNNPGCCTPGSAGCPAKSYEETYGFDWCAGDQDLLQYVGKEGYRDPACDMQFSAATAVFDKLLDRSHDPSTRQSSCDLAFGTSTGVMGLRKFPNPRFDEKEWRELNDGQLGTWEGYNRKREGDDAFGYEVRQLTDGSVEPPFLIGMSCGACHIAFDPRNPPEDSAKPEWDNLLGAIGNQYTRMAEILASGMPENTPEWQIFTHSRPGTVDTSAVPNDQVNNPGTMNAIINAHQRPDNFGHEIIKWREVSACPVEAQESGTCWCDPQHSRKCWKKGMEKERVRQILKGGGDSIGAAEAVQRVYINIGSCSEQCWVNHLTDMRQLDPNQRGYGQTPMDIGQCRRDCPNFRAVEDRIGNILDFLFSKKASSTPLHEARGLADQEALIEQLEDEFDTSIARGKQVFADNCARCHSFVPGGKDHIENLAADADAFLNRDVYALDPDTGLRANWLGNDVAQPASEIGTYRCRSLHSNHMDGHIWQEYASETYRARPADDIQGDHADGGRGYYRSISLLDAWAHAPFMHNNAIGPELCGRPSSSHEAGRRVDFYNSPYVGYQDHNNNKQLDDDEPFTRLSEAPACRAYDPSVQGRFDLFLDSMDMLLNPDKRIPKVTMLDQPIQLDIGPKVPEDDDPLRLVNVRLVIPKDTSAGMFGSFQHKEFFRDLVLSKTNVEQLEARLGAGNRPGHVQEDIQMLQDLVTQILVAPGQIYEIAKDEGDTLLQLYSTCRAKAENNGHRFGEALSPEDKTALTAFMATL